LHGYEVAFGIAAVAAFVGVVAAVLVTPRRERLVVAAETPD
jgi:dipeptide/tripeptide permease